MEKFIMENDSHKIVYVEKIGRYRIIEKSTGQIELEIEGPNIDKNFLKEQLYYCKSGIII